MKKTLVLFFALIIAMSCVSFAAPTALPTVGEASETADNMAANVEQAEVMAEQPSNVLFYEDFESRDDGALNVWSPAYRKDDNSVSTATVSKHNGHAGLSNWNVIQEDGEIYRSCG